MTEEDLQEWLLADGVGEDLRRISIATARLELDGLTEQSGETGDIDWPRLILAGSILARSTSREIEEAALRIATSAILLAQSADIRDAGAILFEKLSNGRAVDLAEKKDLVQQGLHSRLGPMSRIEFSRRLISQTVLEQYSGRWIPVNEFQQALWEGASTERAWLSASAPTAAGKTFLVLHWLMDQMLSTEARVAIYIAPTRALVSELEEAIRKQIADMEVEAKVEVSSLPLKEKYFEARQGGAKHIFVVTQERLHLLANAISAEIVAEVLVVDEAHKIGDGGRGVILQEAIERISRSSDGIRAVFVSPATQNPEVLLQDSPIGSVKRAVDSDAPTVLQNLIGATQKRGRPTAWDLSLYHREHSLSLGVLRLTSRPTNVKKKIAFIAAAAGSRGGTLVYANGAAEAEGIALLVSQMVEQSGSVDQELLELAELSRKGVHPQYQLAGLVERGVAFHYGNMPSLLRSEIERLFRSGKIKFLVCTSTLIEGVNLSCRTIVVRGPRKGKSHPMSAPDFWNLAGRAGRWGDEFQGNIICIDPHDKKAWPSGVPKRARFPIERETDVVLSRGAEVEAFLAELPSIPADQLPQKADLEQLSTYLLATFVREGSILNAGFAKRHDAEYVRRLNSLLAEATASLEIPVEIVVRHPGVSPLGLQRLLESFRGFDGNAEELAPVPPESEDAYDRFCMIMHRINQYVYPAFSPASLVPLHALIVIEWLKGLPLNYMIQRRIAYHRRNGNPFKLGNLIRTTMELVEQTARFKAPKYFSAYVDVLRLHLRQVGSSIDIIDDLDIAVALEFGVSTRTLLSLMELGLSRMTAVALNEKIARDDLDKHGCVSWIREYRSQFEGMDLPAAVVREIDSKVLD